MVLVLLPPARPPKVVRAAGTIAPCGSAARQLIYVRFLARGSRVRDPAARPDRASLGSAAWPNLLLIACSTSRTSGRTFATTRPARFGDLSPGGRLRLDAIARYVQDIASDDTTDAGLENDMAWVARRTAVELRTTPGFREPLALDHVLLRVRRSLGRAAGLDPAASRAPSIETVSLWVHLDAESGRPVPLPGRLPRDLRRGGGRSHGVGPAAAPERGPGRGRSAAVGAALHRLRPARPREQRRHLGHGRGGPGRPSPPATARSGPSSSTACPSSGATRSSWPSSTTPTARSPSG